MRGVLRVLVGLFMLAGSPSALAQDDVDFAGTWQAGSLSVRNATRSWGPDCPRRLPANQQEAGGTVTVRQNGDHLQFSGALSATTRACWGDNPALRRVSSRYQNDTWTIVCRTPENDARAESARYALTASGPNQIRFRETTEWDWQLNNSRCQVTRTATRTFSRAGAETPTPPTPMETWPRCTPGAAAGVRISPTRTRIAPGERVCFSTRVVDAAACTVPGERLSLELRRPEGSSGALRGRCFETSSSSADSEGTYRIVASRGALSASATVVVASEDLSDLVARREGTNLDHGGEAESGGASSVEASATAASGVLPWVLGAVALLLAFVMFMLLHRAKPAEQSFVAPEPEPHAEPVASPPTPPPSVCPLCGFEGDGKMCPHDGMELIDLGAPSVLARGKICPVCRTGYGANDTTCPKDGASLVFYALYDAQQRVNQDAKKTCPTCGRTYGADVAFCPEDGTRL